jgi:benzoylformate decarboxylase
MSPRSFTGNPSQVIVEQLVASGIKHLFYNPGSREARFFDSLYSHPEIHGVIGLHEGTVAAMAGGFAQVNSEPAVLSVHLGAGVAQSLGQMINVWAASLPVVMITFHGDTGSHADRITLDVGHNVSPTAISAPFTKANWTVIEPEGLATAVERAVKVAMTPPIGPVHIAAYDRILGPEQITTSIYEGTPARPRAGHPDLADVEAIASLLDGAKRPMIYVGDGVNKSGAEQLLGQLATHFGVNVASMWGDLRGVSAAHPLHCGYYRQPVIDLEPDRILAIGVRHGASGKSTDFDVFHGVDDVIAVGPDVEIFENIPGLSHAVLADEKRTLEALLELAESEYPASKYSDRRSSSVATAQKLRNDRRTALQSATEIPGKVRPLALLDAVDTALENLGGGVITTEQFAVPLEDVNEKPGGGNNIYIRPAGGSEGYGMGAPLGAKLAAPDKPVVGIVGDGSVYYSDSAFWTAAHHNIPVLYVVPNNGAYGIVAGAFGGANGVMKDTATYSGVALDGIDIVQLADSFGVQGHRVDSEAEIQSEIQNGLEKVEKEGRPMVLDVSLPLGLPDGGVAAPPPQFNDMV